MTLIFQWSKMHSNHLILTRLDCSVTAVVVVAVVVVVVAVVVVVLLN